MTSKGSSTFPKASIITIGIDSSITSLIVFQCHNISSMQQLTSWLIIATHMVGEQSGYEGNGKRREKEVALDQSEVHDSEEKCKVQAYTKGYYTKCGRYKKLY